jgi:hypothetical protein
MSRFMAAIAAATLLLGAAVPTAAFAQSDAANAPGSVPFDVIVLRPVGFVTLGIGTGIFLGSLPLLLVTRPQDIKKPAEILVANPARYLWKDSLGGH